MSLSTLIVQSADMHVSTPHQCSLVHIHICGCILFIHVNLLYNTTQPTHVDMPICNVQQCPLKNRQSETYTTACSLLQVVDHVENM